MALTKVLTKQMLIDWGFEVGEPIENGYVIYRTYYHNKKWNKIAVKLQEVTFKNKYTPVIRYQQVQFHYNSKRINIYVHRFIYAWFYGEAPQGYDIDHIDNNPQNNRIENLQLLTREENIKKKIWDNPNVYKRMIYNIKKMKKYEKFADRLEDYNKNTNSDLSSSEYNTEIKKEFSNLKKKNEWEGE